MNDRTFLSCAKMHDNGDMTSYSKWRKMSFCVTMKLDFEKRRMSANGDDKRKRRGIFYG